MVLTACAVPVYAQRQEVLLNADWRFRFYHEVERGTAERVDLPHTWNAQDALAGQLDYWRGIGCYEKRLAVREEWRGKRLFDI